MKAISQDAGDIESLDPPLPDYHDSCLQHIINARPTLYFVIVRCRKGP